MSRFWKEFENILQQGGPGLLWLLVLSALLYASLFFLSAKIIQLLPIRRGQLPQDAAKALAQTQDRRDITRIFARIELGEIGLVQRHLPFAAILTGAAPLAGLLGTVSGMLATFAGLAAASAAQPIEKISAGVSEALITTQAGLVIAIPASIITALLHSQLRATENALQEQLHQALAQVKTSK